ncbi:glutaredoxin domain-containing protein [Litoribacillus peritrichatus]|uniref:Glutaredoxin domain-containing protein n=1 Tax=Litoribacillus peritrichatus TaxID=718191 RepID=A0ABP7LVA9_9GAMM
MNLLKCSLFIILFSVVQISLATPPNTTSTNKVQTNKVYLFTQTFCPSCIYAKKYMTEQNIDFIELDIETNPQALSAFQKINGRGTPMMVINKQISYGFDKEFLEANIYSEKQ